MNNKQLAVLVASGFIGVAVLVWVFAPPGRIAEITGRLPEKTPADRCLEYMKRETNFKDPGSVELVTSEKVGYALRIRYKAKNSFGAYMSADFECVEIGDQMTHSTAQRFADIREASQAEAERSRR